MSTKNNKDADFFAGLALQAEENHKETMEKAMVNAVKEPSKEERATSLISMTKAEKQRLTELSKAHGLSLSAFVRLATDEYIANHGW